VFIYLKQEFYYNLINRGNSSVDKIEYINKLDRYFNIIINLLITGGNTNNEDENIQKAIQITSTSFINVSNRNEFQSMRNTFKIFNEIEQSLLLLENQITNKNDLYITLLYLYSPNITYNYIITPENEEIINNNQFKITDEFDKTFIINSVNAITEPILLTYIDLINEIFVDQNVNQISAIVSNGNQDENNAYQVYISSLLFTNNNVYVYDFITNITTLLLYGNESEIDIYNNKYIDLIKIVLTNDILE
jgi:predicted small secreted protein